MKIETLIMQRFVEIIESDEALFNPLMNRHQVYRDMVYHRFSETISNTYPILSERLGERLHGLIREFQRSGAKSVLMSDMASEFGDFLKNHPIHREFPYLEDLLWFEYSEMELLLEQFKEEEAAFSWSGHYRLSSSSRVKQLSYPLHRGDFEDSGIYPLLLYYDFEESRVYFEEITPFAYTVLTMFRVHAPNEVLEALSRSYEVDQDDLLEPLEQLLNQWCNKKIIMYEV